MGFCKDAAPSYLGMYLEEVSYGMDTSKSIGDRQSGVGRVSLEPLAMGFEYELEPMESCTVIFTRNILWGVDSTTYNFIF